jgi:acetylornithine/succinyldiaminopimelate/putrescine aminotransferase/predicted amino acid dehydrogenase
MDTAGLTNGSVSRPAFSDCSARAAYGEFVKPRVAELLRAVELDVIYHRGEGDYLWYRDADGHEQPVLDLLGGFGASLFGHNSPVLVACLQRQLASNRPFNAQASVRGLAGLLGRRLSERAGRATGQSYVTTFGSSGAEVVEAALKHAEMEAWQKRSRLVDEMKRVMSRVRNAHGQGLDVLLAQPIRGLARGHAALESMLEGLIAQASAELARPAVVVALHGAFHGKTSGALRLTHNPVFRGPWERWGQAVFLPPEDVTALHDAVARSTVTLLLPVWDPAGQVRLVPTPFVNVLAFFCEPIQGEGGVHELTPAYLAELRRVADEHDVPLVIDEIQCGMGRTGRFFASEWSGVRGDYYLLSKSLGGGLTKIAALLVERQRYVSDFGYLHTSTFAEDDASCAVALAALDLLEDSGGALLQRCCTKGHHLLARLRALAQEFPDQIEAVRGRGLMVGVALWPQTGSPSTLLRVLSEQRLLSFFLAGYLLRKHSIRVAPALSAHGTLRLEPSAGVALEALDRFVAALREGLALLREADVAALTGLASSSGRHARVEVLEASPVEPAAHVPRRHVAFLAHLRDARDVRLIEPALAALQDDQCRELMGRIQPVLAPFRLARESIRSALGHSVDLSVIALPFTAAHALAALRGQQEARVLTQVQAAVDLAAQLGCSLVGCGGYTSILSDNCRTLITEGLGVTSGNSLTAAVTAEALLRAAERRAIEPRMLGVVGASGNIGAMLCELTSERVERVVLVGRAGAASRLRRVADRLSCPVTISTRLDALRDCSLILSATNAVEPIILPEHIGPRPVVICDAAVPQDVSAAVPAQRPNAVVLRAGLVRLPLGQELRCAGISVAPATVYACLAEVALLGLSGVQGSFSYGALRMENVRLIRALADHHGFTAEENVGLEPEAWRGLHG